MKDILQAYFLGLVKHLRGLGLKVTISSTLGDDHSHRAAINGSRVNLFLFYRHHDVYDIGDVALWPFGSVDPEIFKVADPEVFRKVADCFLQSPIWQEIALLPPNGT